MPLLAQESTAPRHAHGWVANGIQDYKSARYEEAVIDFQNALALNPNDVTARLYL